jgi:hypothetical protein
VTDLLACILQHVPLRQQLTCCAVVCRAWHAAVRKTAKHVKVATSKHNQVVHLSNWLQTSGGGLRSITLEWTSLYSSIESDPSYHYEQLQIPVDKLPQLERISLAACDPIFAETGQGKRAATATATMLTQLRSLELSNCLVQCSEIVKLTAPTNLAAIWLHDTFFPDPEIDNDESWGQVIYPKLNSPQVDETWAQVLASLPRFNSLCVNQNVGPKVQAALSSMQNLRELSLPTVRHGVELAPNYAFLPTDLTALTINVAMHDSVRITQETIPHGSSLSQLCRLELDQLEVDPALFRCSNLQHLTLNKVSPPAQPEVTAAATDDVVVDGEGNANVAAVLEEHKPCVQWQLALMDAVGSLTQLRHLNWSMVYEGTGVINYKPALHGWLTPGPDRLGMSASFASMLSGLVNRCLFWRIPIWTASRKPGPCKLLARCQRAAKLGII